MKCLTTCCNNCESDDDEFIIVDVLKDVPVENLILQKTMNCRMKIILTKPSILIIVQTVQSQMKLLIILTHIGSQYIDSSLEMCSITYFSGYLAKKCFDKFHCAHCNLIKPNEHLTDDKELLIIHKVFDHVQKSQGLKAPSDELTQSYNILKYI